ncbi:MAG: biotin transport system substrate-specific component [Alphaproteobacteria bacterium]|jgi:biotin transport system substrate-specific component
MNASLSAANGGTLATRLWPSLSSSLVLKAAIVVTGSVLLWASAKISVPLLPVKMTMGLFVVLALGLTLGARLAGATVLLYLIEGASGMPVFTGTPEKGLGIAYMMGPTGGYLLGYLLAAVVTGWLADKGFSRSPMLAILAALVGAVIVYIPGLLWLGMLLGWDKPILAWGLYPFLLPDAVKVLLAGLVVSGAWGLLGRKSA